MNPRSVPKAALARPLPTRQTRQKGRLNFLYPTSSDARRSGVAGAFSAAVSWGVGEYGSSLSIYSKVAISATAGGVASVIQGGKFGHGFFSAGVTAAASPYIYSPKTHPAIGATAAAILGGTVSEMTGGKFANGAVSGAFSYAIASAGAVSRGLTTGSDDGPVSGANDFDVILSRSYGSPDAAAIGFGGDYGPNGIRDRIEYNTAIVETFAADEYGPSAYSYASPLAGDVGAKTVPLRAYLRAVADTHGARNVVAIAHNHFDNNHKFTGIGLDTSVAQVMPLYVYNRAGETRVLNSTIIQREIAGFRGASALKSYINVNNGMNGRCIHGCR